MIIEETQITALRIKDIPHLDPIRVLLEDHGNGAGKVIVECFGKAWSAFWGGMGKRSLPVFFCECNAPYIIGKFAPMLQSTQPADCGMVAHLQKRICERRKDDMLSKERARELYDIVPIDVPDDADSRYLGEVSLFPIYEVLGDEWWYDLPTEPNHEYEYLKRIVEATQQGLRKWMEVNQ